MLKRHKHLSEKRDFEENALLERRFFYAINTKKMRKYEKQQKIKSNSFKYTAK